MTTVKISEVAWLSRAGEEAILTVTDGTHVCLSFAHPFGSAAVTSVRRPLVAFDVRELVRTNDGRPGFRNVGTGLSQMVTGIVVDPKARLVAVGGIRIELDLPLPGDLVPGEEVTFVCARLDFVS